MNADFPFHKYQTEVPSNVKEYMETSNFNRRNNTCSNVAWEILGYIPILGTIKGAIDGIKEYKLERKTDNWGKGKIIMNLFSFLVVPQIVYGIVCAYDAIQTKRQQDQAARAELMDGISSGIKASGDAAESFEKIGNNMDKIRNEGKSLFGDAAQVLF